MERSEESVRDEYCIQFLGFDVISNLFPKASDGFSVPLVLKWTSADIAMNFFVALYLFDKISCHLLVKGTMLEKGIVWGGGIGPLD